MKKFSTLALALIAMGTVTSAWATSTDNLPTGYYKIKSAVTGNSNITNIHMFNDAFLEVNTPKATLLSAETAETNNYIWYVTNTGGSKISIVNGQGTGIKLEDGNKGKYTYQGPYTELTPVDANSTYPTSIYFSEGLYTPNTSGAQSDNHQYGSYTAAAYWNAPNEATTKWSFESVSVEDKGVYTVTVTGSADGYVTRTATSEHAFNGGFFIVESGSTISADDLTAGAVEGFTSNVSVDASTKTITVTYAVNLATLVDQAYEAISHTSAGYPLEGSESRTNLQKAIDAVSGTGDVQTQYNNLNTALTAYKSDKNVKMPEDGKVYVFTNVQQDGTCYYLSYSNDDLKITTRGTAAAESLDNSAKFVCRVVDGKYVFVNVKDGKFLVWKGSGLGSSNGTNSAKGYIDKYEADYANLTVSKNDIYPCLNIGGKRSDTENANFIINKNGTYNAISMQQWNTADNTTAFKFEEVPYPNTVTFNTVSDVEGVSKIATFSAPFATVVPTDVTAYYVSTADNSKATMKAIEAGKAIPANAGVILTSTTGDKATMLPATTETVADLTGNKLGNTAGAEKILKESDNAYILAGGADGTAFYKGTIGTTLKANKAYLTLAGAEHAISMNFGGNVTGINQIVNAEQNNAPVYDLTGRRVVRTVKDGLYIKGSNKFIAR